MKMFNLTTQFFTRFGIILLYFTFMSVSQCEICEEHIVNGLKQSAYGCPRLTDLDNQIFCCGKSNTTLYCCSNKNLSIYRNHTNTPATSTWGSIIGKTMVCFYGFLVAVIAIIDAISHCQLKKKSKKNLSS